MLGGTPGTVAGVVNRVSSAARRRAKLVAPHVLTRLPGSSTKFGPPRKLVATAAEWTNDWNTRCGPEDAAELVWVHDAMAMDWSPSIGIEDLDSSRSGARPDEVGALATGAHHDGQPTFVLTMPRGRVAGSFGSVITPDDHLLADVSFGFVDDDRHHPVRRQLTLGPLKHLEGTAATVAFGHADAYFHWLYDVLPRLEILRLAGWDENTWDHLVVNGAGAAYERETLDRFGVPADRVRPLDARTHVVADRLVVPSTVGIPGTVPAWSCQLLRDRLLPARRPDAPPLRLYVSRADTEQRRVADEDGLVARLESLGFTCVTLSGRPLDDQIELFSRAEVVIGPHGGGLSNLVWCEPGTAVVELYTHDYVNPVFWGVSQSLGLRHYHVIGRPAVPGLPRSFGPMAVDHDAVVRLAEHAIDGLTLPPHTDRP